MNRIIKEIDREDKKNPYTDQELSDMLGIKRSDIVNFRKEKGIPNSRDRRRDLVMREIRAVIMETPDITERGLTDILVKNGYRISRSAVAKMMKEVETKGEFLNKKTENNDISIKKITEINKKIENDLINENVGFENLIGINGSLKEKVNLAKSAIMYPPNGLHTIIYGESGVGKSELANCMYEYAVKKKIKDDKSPFIVFNCADYAENPNLLISQLFGVVKGAYTGAGEDRAGLVEKADGGILFLDEIHRLPPSGQEILFSLIDRGEYRRLGESSNKRKANVLIISATTENPESSLLTTFRRRIPMFITLPNLDSRSVEERYEIILKFFERESKRINRNIIVTKEVLYALMNYKCKGNIGQLKSDIQVSCARAFSKSTKEDNKVIIDTDSLREHIKKSLPKENKILKNEKYDTLEDIYIDINEINNVNKNYFSKHEVNEIYRYVEKELKVLEGKNYSEDEIKNIFFDKLDKKFNQIKKNNIMSDRSEKQMISMNLKNETVEIVDKVFELLKNQYESINNALYPALAMHLEHAIQRLKDGKKIINPGLEKIKKSFTEEYEIARYVVGIVEDVINITFPDDELGYIAYYIHKFCMNKDEVEQKVKVIIATHGKVGIEMSKVVNNVLGLECTYGIEVPLEESPSDGVESAMLDIINKGFNTDILLLMDMGSLIILGDKIEESLGVRCKVLSRVDTVLAMEAGKAAVIEGKSLDAIIYDLKDSTNISVINQKNGDFHTKASENKENILITICLSGKGTAITVKDILEKQLKDMKHEEIKVVPLGMILENEFEDEIKQYEKEFNIIAICGTIDIGYNNIPFISYSDVMNGKGAERVVEILKSNKNHMEKDNHIGLKNLIYEELVLENIEGISKEYIIDTLVKKLEDGGFVDSRYILSVYKREAMGSVVISQKVAIPHGLPENVIKPAIAIAKLSKPIIWDNEFMVEVIVLIAMKENNKSEIKDLLFKLSDLEFMEELLKTNNKREIIELFSEEY